MHREWSIWLGFMAVVIAAVVFVVGRDDDNGKGSQLSAGTSLPTTTAAPSTTEPPTTTSSSSTTAPPDTTTPPTTERATSGTTESTSPAPALSTPTTPAPTTSAPTTPPTSPQPRIQFGPGTYRVGVDLPAGTYRTDGGPSCFWARLSSFGGTADSVIAGEYTDGAAATVTVQPTDAGFSTAGCAVWLSV